METFWNILNHTNDLPQYFAFKSPRKVNWIKTLVRNSWLPVQPWRKLRLRIDQEEWLLIYPRSILPNHQHRINIACWMKIVSFNLDNWKIALGDLTLNSLMLYHLKWNASWLVHDSILNGYFWFGYVFQLIVWIKPLNQPQPLIRIIFIPHSQLLTWNLSTSQRHLVVFKLKCLFKFSYWT